MSHQEVDHRVANSLQLISSLLSIQAREASDQSVRDALLIAVRRINAVAAVHQQLYRSSSAHAIDIASYLLDLTAKIEQVCSGSVGRKQITAHIQSLVVPAGFASMLGILINELVINACKHAYAPDEPGDIDVYLFFPNQSEFRMEVRDYCGVADVHKVSITSGLGMRIIDAMCHKLNAAYAHVADEEGTRFLMRGTVFPSGV
ncbi:sensor histidine kinase [Sinorhizobium mexicanum]|uniref:histidine kinase n=1 Tax=Sinorhizobium mexicanum TaxID=375549 RepID=A0A859QFU2_9HYPH|nr:sensor histidine kinase [Sinorhizobium mexicanum]MBP1888312.1 two-component sensor histidine kinase [Sinorhizobium mexicanum]QLL64142.1 sensor histidine kinase [Sinorhizobium mexicanum]